METLDTLTNRGVLFACRMQTKRSEVILADLLKIEPNRRCADCGQKGTIFLKDGGLINAFRDTLGFLEHWRISVH